MRRRRVASPGDAGPISPARLLAVLARLRPHSDQCGVAPAAGRRVPCLDLFDRPDALHAPWDRLVPAYAADAIGEGDVEAGDAEAFVRGAFSARATEQPSVGIATVPWISGDHVSGAGLRGIVHMALFPAPVRQSARSDGVRRKNPT